MLLPDGNGRHVSSFLDVIFVGLSSGIEFSSSAMPSRKRTGPGRRGLPHDFQYAHPAWMKPIFRDERSESYSYTSESEDDEMLCLQDSEG